MQSVFRVKPSNRKPQNHDNHSQAASQIYRPRRTHRKSRYGCQNCKRRRVKCDENSDPGCQNCQRHGIDCDYVASLTGTSALVISAETSLIRTSPLGSTGSTPSALTGPFSPSAQLCRSPGFISPLFSPSEQPDDIAPVMQTLSFFETFTCTTVTTIDGLSVFKGSILALAHHREYLFHAILGMSAGHLRAMSGTMEDQRQSQRYSKTESYHWHRAIKQYRAELTNEASVDHVDSLITTSMLIGLYRFQVDGPEDTSFVDAPPSERQAKLQWLIVPMGFPAVLQHVRRLLGFSVWKKVFSTAVPAEHGWTVDLTSTKGILVNFLDLCAIGLDLEGDDVNPYRKALKDLFALFQIERLTMRDMAQVVSFMSRLNGNFQGLLVALDSRALLILLYWLAVLEDLNVWWAKGRAAQEARAIIQHLEWDEDVRIQNLLTIPRRTFAHILEG